MWSGLVSLLSAVLTRGHVDWSVSPDRGGSVDDDLGSGLPGGVTTWGSGGGLIRALL